MLQTYTDKDDSFFGALWGKSWTRRVIIAAVLAVIVIVWWRINTGIIEGRPPLISWMILAKIACAIMFVLAMQQLAKLAADLLKEGADRLRISAAKAKTVSLIVQFLLIIVGNTIAIALIFYQGAKWTPFDWLNVIVASAAMSPMFAFEALRRVDASWRWLNAMQPVLETFRWGTPEAKCLYILALKAFPQASQTVVVLLGLGRVDIWGVIFLFVLGSFRLYEAWGVRKFDGKSRLARALLVSTVADFTTMTALLAVVLMRVV